MGNRLPAKGEQESCSFMSQSLHFVLPTDNSAPAKTLVASCLCIMIGGRGKELS